MTISEEANLRKEATPDKKYFAVAKNVVLVAEATETSSISAESNEPYPVPTIKTKIKPEAGPFPVNVNAEGRMKKNSVACKCKLELSVTIDLNEPAIPETGGDKDSFVSETQLHAASSVPVPSGPNVALQLPLGNAIPSTWIVVLVVQNSASAGARLAILGLQSASGINNDAATKKSKIHRVIEPSARNQVDQ